MPTDSPSKQAYWPIKAGLLARQSRLVGSSKQAYQLVKAGILARQNRHIGPSKQACWLVKADISACQSKKNAVCLQKSKRETLPFSKFAVPLQRKREIRISCAKHLGIWCNGNTTDSGPVILGSSPSIPTIRKSSGCIQPLDFFHFRPTPVLVLPPHQCDGIAHRYIQAAGPLTGKHGQARGRELIA